MKIYPPGALIAGRYEVAGRPLMGGMGIVYVCLDHQDNRPVALKTFKPEYLPDRAARDRFLREGTAWVDLGVHPHVVRCYEVERIGDGTEVYLVLELVAKELGHDDASLRSWLIPGRPLPLETALLFALQIARGMQHATERLSGFIHRDLKPENVLVGADRLPGWRVNRLRLTDFGLATVLEAASQRIGESAGPREAEPTNGPAGDSPFALRHTQLTRGIVGTPLYMAPEQWRGEKISIATDIYAFGCILYEMLSGQRVARGDTLEALEQARCYGRIPPLAKHVPIVVQKIAARCLMVKPDARYTNWKELGNALQEAYQATTHQTPPPSLTRASLSQAERIAVGGSYNAIGASYLDIGKADAALSYFERSAKVGRAERSSILEIAALNNLGAVYAALGDAQTAIRFYEQALGISRKVNARREIGTTLNNLGIACRNLGNVQQAIELSEQALVIAREVGDRRLEGTVLSNLGIVYKNLGDARRAVGCYEQALTIFRELGDRRGEGTVLVNLGVAYKHLGNLQRAISYVEQALSIAREIGDRRGEGNALGNLGEAYRNLKDARRAIIYHEQALAIFREIGNQRGEGAALGNLGVAYNDLGDTGRAISYYDQALAIRREIGDRRGEANDLGNLGVAYKDLGDAQRAIGYFEQALTIRGEIGDIDGVAMDLFNMALLYAQQGDFARALPPAQEAAGLWAQIGHPNAQRAQQLIVQLQCGAPVGGDLSPPSILQQFAAGIAAVVAGARGDRQARAAVAAEFARLMQEGWLIVEPIQRIWAGERDEAALTAGIDPNSALIVREILRQLAR